jgi:DNA-binding MarR family transcriptional regulator
MEQNTLTPNQAILLQQIYEDDEDDIRSLSDEVGISRTNTIRGVLKLEQKGLVDLHDSFDGLVLRVSVRGRAVVRKIWPEAKALFV